MSFRNDAVKYDVDLDLSAQNAPALVLSKIKPGSDVLEFGPATGYMTRHMKEALGCRVTAIEFDPAAAEITAPFCEKILVRDIDRDPWFDELTRGSFDYVIFADVLEHLYDPWAALKKAVDLLKPGGSLITSIPNVGHSAILLDLMQGKFEYRDTGLLDRTHIRFFTRKSMFELFRQAGLDPVECLGTLKAPDLTEMDQSYDNAPGSLRAALRSSPDSEVYQFVCVLRRASEVMAPAGDSLARQPVSGQKEYFWRITAGKTLGRLYVIDDGEWHVYRLPIPVPFPSEVIFDLMVRPAYYEIRSIRTESGSRPPSAISLSETRGIRIVGSDGDQVRFVSWNHEPQMIFPLAKAALDPSAEGNSLCFELKVVARPSAAVLKYEEILQHWEAGSRKSRLMRIALAFKAKVKKKFKHV